MPRATSSVLWVTYSSSTPELEANASPRLGLGTTRSWPEKSSRACHVASSWRRTPFAILPVGQLHRKQKCCRASQIGHHLTGSTRGWANTYTVDKPEAVPQLERPNRRLPTQGVKRELPDPSDF